MSSWIHRWSLPVLSLNFALVACGPPQVELREAYAEEAVGTVSFDHGLWDELLKRHVRDGGFVDYGGINKESGQLDRYLASLAAAEFDVLGRDEKLAFLINAYNAFTVRLILDHYPLASIEDIPGSQRWSAVRWKLAGETVSLDQIEHERVRPRFAEPRIHFALVCAAVGCPPLRNEAFVGDRLEEQLQDQTEYVHSHGRWFAFDSDQPGRVQLTKLYDWYGEDFVQAAGSVLAYAARFSPALSSVLEAGTKPSVSWLDYSWKLNSVDNAK